MLSLWPPLLWDSESARQAVECLLQECWLALSLLVMGRMEQEEADFCPAMVLGVVGTLDAVPGDERQDPPKPV